MHLRGDRPVAPTGVTDLHDQGAHGGVPLPGVMGLRGRAHTQVRPYWV